MKNFNNGVFSKLRNYKYHQWKFYTKCASILICFLMIVTSLFRPQWGEKMIKTEAKGIDIVFTIDVSQSMKAIDMSVKGIPISRLSITKEMIKNFIESNPNNRYGLVIFAGEAFVSTPLTLDQSAFLTFLEGVDYTDIGKQGTNLEEALKSSISRFKSQDAKDRGKAIIFISDGGDEVEGDFSKFAKIAEEEMVKVFTIGVGSKENVPIPESQDVFGTIYYKQYKGETVYTKLNEKPLLDIASKTNGKYFYAEKTDDLKRISDDISKLQSTLLASEQIGDKEDRYQWFLTVGFLSFLVFLMI